MTEYASFDDLVTTAEESEAGEDLTLPSGKVIRVCGLSRQQWFQVGKMSNNGDPDAGEAKILELGIVAPKLKAREVHAWRAKRGASADVDAAVQRIRELTGLGEGAQKSRVSGDGEQPGA